MRKKRKKKTKNLKTENFLHEQYSQSWQFLKESRNYILTIAIIFFLFAIIGFFYSTPEITELIMNFLEKLIEEIQGLNTQETIAYIIYNNLKSALIGMILGVILGIIPILTAALNGYILGFVSSKAVEVTSFLTILKLLPHGIFELPALFIALGIGLKLGLQVLTSKEKKKTFFHNIENSFRVFLYIILPLIIAAGIIEGLLIKLMG